MLAEAAAVRRSKGPVAIAPRQAQSAESTTPSSTALNERAASDVAPMVCQKRVSLPLRLVGARGLDIDTKENRREESKTRKSALVKQCWSFPNSIQSIPTRHLTEPTFATKQCAAILQNNDVRRIHHYGMLNHLPF